MIPKDAREVYLNEQGEPIAFCPKESTGLTDLMRGVFYRLNEERMRQLLARAVEKGDGWVAVCIDVDDPTWTWLADALMSGHDWQQYRDRGKRPVARGVVPRDLLLDTVAECYPVALPAPDGPFIAVFAAGGATLLKGE